MAEPVRAQQIVRRGKHGSIRMRRAMIIMASASGDAGQLAALGGQDVGVAGVGVAPAQVVLELAGQQSSWRRPN